MTLDWDAQEKQRNNIAQYVRPISMYKLVSEPPPDSGAVVLAMPAVQFQGCPEHFRVGPSNMNDQACYHLYDADEGERLKTLFQLLIPDRMPFCFCPSLLEEGDFVRAVAFSLAI